VASLKLAALAHAAGLGYQLGCHPGETGILSAAGRHWACIVGNIRYAEGSYDRHVFSRPLTNDDMTFGFGGRAPAIRRHGLGVTMNEASLKELTVTRQEFNVS
jgi:muconate cycloisomerase